VAWLKDDARLAAVIKDHVVHTRARLWPFTFVDDSWQDHLSHYYLIGHSGRLLDALMLCGTPSALKKPKPILLYLQANSSKL
jgi:hypothetical protein